MLFSRTGRGEFSVRPVWTCNRNGLKNKLDALLDALLLSVPLSPVANMDVAKSKSRGGVVFGCLAMQARGEIFLRPVWMGLQQARREKKLGCALLDPLFCNIQLLLKLHFGQVYAVDVLISTGDGQGREKEAKITIYKKTDETYMLKMKTSREFYSKVCSLYSSTGQCSLGNGAI